MRRVAIVTAILLVATGTWYTAFRAFALARYVDSELNRAGTLTDLAQRSQATIVYDRTGKAAFTFFVEQRIDVPLDRISPYMLDAIVAIEDRRFFSHHGIDPARIGAAAWRNFRAGRIVEGGSTITQQLARVSQLTPVRTYERKVREIMLAARLEERYTKPQILEEYLNTVYLGEGYYGVEAASRGYFGKSAFDLKAHEAALLAALVRSPSRDAPCVSPARALKRRNLVLRLMREQGMISEEAFQRTTATPIPDRSHQKPAGGVLAADGSESGLYFQEEVRRQLFALFGAEKVLRGGLRVYSTYDPAMQREAESAVTMRIAQIAKARPAARNLQGSLVAMDPVTGEVRALVGGRDFKASSYNRATQARRQAGSAFKPIIYAAALERGYSPGTILRELDAPIDAGGATTWLPAGDHERSEYTLRRALKVSSNRAAAQLLQQVGVSTAVYYAHRLGIESELPMVPSLALGTGEVTLLELTAAYTAFANHGMVATPRLITRVENAEGISIFDAPERRTQAISATTAFLMSSMLADVISSGTGYGARTAGFKLPAAGKTGTTDEYADAWFVGYTPHLVAGIWFGLDKPAPIMRGGFAGVVAVPAWGNFMRAATAGDAPDWYEMPGDVEKVAICRLSGSRASDACRHPAEAYSVSAGGTGAQLLSANAMHDQAEAPVIRTLAAGDTAVYEDLFPLGAVSSEPCPLHDVPLAAYPNTTPVVDSILQTSVATPSPAYAGSLTMASRPASSDIVLERVLGPDGVMRLVMRQRR
jgi:1A family penicillin-binding protein